MAGRDNTQSALYDEIARTVEAARLNLEGNVGEDLVTPTLYAEHARTLRELAYAWRALAGGQQPGSVSVQADGR